MNVQYNNEGKLIKEILVRIYEYEKNEIAKQSLN